MQFDAIYTCDATSVDPVEYIKLYQMHSATHQLVITGSTEFLP